MNAKDHSGARADSTDELERAAETLERPLASVIGDYQEVGTDSTPTRGVFLLPNMITTGALLFSCY